MNLDKQEELVRLFPQLYTHLDWGFECGDGWYDLLKELSEKLMPLVKSLSYDDEYETFETFAEQVKEKYGTLRFYMNWSSDGMEELIDEAQAKSAITCESCGKPGKLNSGPWYEVRCEECK